jgi:hypothetical protein
MISTATKTLQANNKMIYVALLSTLTFFLFLDYIPGLEACSAKIGQRQSSTGRYQP